jgi:methyl-accepting chemotaxis protein
MTWRALGLYMAWGLLFSPILAYVDGMILGLEGVEEVARLLLPLFLSLGVAYPAVVLRVLVRRALEHRPEEAPGARLGRLLRLPWRAAFLTSSVGWTLGGFCFGLGVWLGSDRSPWLLVMNTFIGLCCGTVLALPFGLTLERRLLPWALEEQRRHPAPLASGRGLSWPRLSWFLPFAFLASLLSTVLLSTCLVLARLADSQVGVLLEELGSALAWVGVLVLVLPTLTTWLLARRLAAGCQAIRTAIEALASGQVRAPDWSSTDELGELAAGMTAAMDRLQRIPVALHSSALRLQEAGNHLHRANLEQQQSLTQQAAALHEARVTSEKLLESSLLAAERAQAVLRMAQHADALGQHGEAATTQSRAGLASLQEFVSAIQEKLLRLQESARQIGDVTRTVKELADQSNILALNAAIEAVRSAEHGKGFSVVAREIRALANQSAGSTQRIRALLEEEVLRAIRDAAALGDKGTEEVAHGLSQMQASGDSLRELSRMAKDISGAVKEITVAVTQQGTSFTEMFQTLSNLSLHMDATLERLAATQEAAMTLRSVSDEVERLSHQLNA